MLNANAIAGRIMLKDTFLTNIESPVKRVIAQIIVWVLCFLGLTVTFFLAARIILMVFLFFCLLMNYVPPVPFLTE